MRISTCILEGEKMEGAEAVRLRWYGGTDVKQVFDPPTYYSIQPSFNIELGLRREKVSQGDWTGEKSVKARFPIKEDEVDTFIRGAYTMDEEFEELCKKGKKTRQEVDSMIQLANEVQYSVLTRKLHPGTYPLHYEWYKF
jgi:SPX domain protein involved in polyphosphate accumulation